mgnify:CR=1 FL=1
MILDTIVAATKARVAKLKEDDAFGADQGQSRGDSTSRTDKTGRTIPL